MTWETVNDCCSFKGHRRRIATFGLACFLLLTLLPAYSFAGVDMTVFGPKRYDRFKGAPNLYTDTFERCEPSDLALLRVTNGNGKDTTITSGQISINGTVVVDENDFKQQTLLIEKAIPVTQLNELKVELKSSSRERSFVIIEIIGRNCDSMAPVIFAPSPGDGALLKTARPTIAASYRDEANGSGINQVSAILTLDGTDVTAEASITASGITYLPAADLPYGEHETTLTIADRAANSTSLVWHFTTDTVPPEFKITSPGNGRYLNTPLITVSGDINDPTARVTLNGTEAEVSGQSFSLAGFQLVEGSNTIIGNAQDPAGNPATDTITVVLDTLPPVITIASPAMDAFVNTPRIDVSGMVDDVSTSVTVNGITAAVSGNNFALGQFELAEGENVIMVEAEDRAVNKTSAEIKINLDTVAPVIGVTSPVPDSWVNTPLITVSGTVTEDNLEGFWINDVATAVNNGDFSWDNFPLSEGNNQIKMLALDRAGNESTIFVPVNLDTVLPVVTITAPVTGLLTNNAQVTVSGRISEEFTAVTVNGIAADVTGKDYTLAYTLAEGVNTLTVRATDRAGNIGSYGVSVTLDSTPPAAPVLAPLHTPTNVATVTVSGTAEAGSTVKISNAAGAAVGTVTADAQRNFALANVILVEGINSFSATATDAAVNLSEVSSPATAALDTVLPVVKITSQVNEQFLNTPVVTISGTLDDPTAPVTVNGTPAVVAGNSFSLAGVTLAEGRNTIAALATDPAGNHGSDGIIINLDTQKPIVSISAPLSGFLTKDQMVTVSGAISEEFTAVTVNGMPAVVTGKNFTLIYSLTEGANILDIEAADRAGNTGSASVTGTFDSTPPVTPEFTTVPSPTKMGSVTLRGNTEAGAAVKIFAGATLLGTVSADPQGSFVLSDVTLVEGDNSFTATATDLAGNESAASQPLVIVLDTQAPQLAVSTLADGSYTNNETLNITGTALDNIALHELRVNGTSVPVNADGSYSHALVLQTGANTIAIVLTDKAGNQASDSRTITLDQTVPVITIATPADNSKTKNPILEFKGSVDNEAVVELKVKDSVYAAIMDGLNFTAAITAEYGYNTIEITAVDLAGNRSTVKRTVIFDDKQPSLAVTEPGQDIRTNQGSMAIKGTAGDELTAVTVAVSMDGQNFSPALVSGGFEQAVTFGAEKSYAVTVTATDEVGMTTSVQRNIIYDITPPALTIAPVTTPTNQASQVLTGTMEAGATVSVVCASATVGEVSYPSSGTWSATLSNLSVDANSISVEALDATGNTSSVSAGIIYDNTPPTGSITVNTGATVTGAAPVQLQLESSDGTGVTSMRFSSDLITWTDATAFSVSAPWSLLAGDGLKQIYVQYQDLAGNWSDAFSTSITLDTTAPVITVATPVADAFVNVAQMTVSGTVNEPVTSVTVNGTSASLTDLGWSLPYTLTEGVNTFTITATDLAGNVATSTVSVNLDTQAPGVTINTPAAGLLTSNPQVTVSGTVSEEFATVTVNGIPAIVTGTSWSLGYTLAEMGNTLTVQAVDRAGNTGNAAISVTLDSIIPAAPVLAAPVTPTNVATLTLTGTAEAMATVKIYAGAALIGTVAADAQGSFNLANITLAEEANNFSASATDSAGNESLPSLPVTAILDTLPPVITVAAPAENTFFSAPQITVTGNLNEPVAALSANGQPVTLQSAEFEQALTLTPGLNSIILVATDLAGNSATKTVLVTLDATPPVVTITAPVSGGITKTAQVTVAGTISKPFTSATINGTTVTVTDQTFNFLYTLQEGENTLTVEATDRAGNTGSAAVTKTLDTQLPVLTIQTPAEAAAGSNVAIALSASDTNPLTLVELKADGVPIWSGGNSLAVSESVAYRLSPSLNAGGQVLLQARGVDSAGNEGSASATITITQGAVGPGYLQGKVLDDTRGLRMEGAAVALTDAAGVTTSLTSAVDGGYFAETASGQTLVTITRPGYTSVERLVAVLPEKKASAVDARLTRISATSNQVNATGGTIRAEVGTGTVRPVIELEIPAGAIAVQSDLRLTPVSNQGLAGLLPLGWSPLAVVDLRLLEPNAGTQLEVAFTSAATIKFPVTASMPAPDAVVTLAAYDASSHQWRTKGNATVAADGLSASASLDGAGQYALVVADPAPNAPEAAVAGSPLAAASAGSLNFDAVAAQGKVVPQAAPPATGLKAAGEVVLTAIEGEAPAFTSGLLLNSQITENFDLKSGDTVQTPSYAQDIILYRYPCLTSIGFGALSSLNTASSLRTTFPVSPSKDYSIVELLLGKVGLDITVPEAVETGVMVGTDGGRLVDADGNILSIPQGALTQTTPVSTKNGAAAAGAVGADFTLLKVVEVNLTRQTLAHGAVLSIAAPASVDPLLPLVLAQQIDVKGVAKLKLVALARQSGSLISSDTVMAGITLPGITTSGNYYFLQAKGPIGFVTGTVTDAAGSAYNGTLVKTAQGSLVDLTPATGNYLVAAPVALLTATAIDLYKNDEVSGSGTLTAPNQVITLDLKILMLPPTLVSVAPNGINIQPNAPVVATFSKSIDKTSISTTTLKLTDANGDLVPGVFTFSVDSKVVTFSPSDLLNSEQSYSVTVDGGIKDLQGYSLATNSVSGFTVRKTTPPPMPAAGAVSGTFPDAEGFITVTATQGSAEPGNTVLLINDATGEIVSVTPASNGSFTGRIRAQLGDEIQVVLMDYSGNRTLISYITFKSDDGKYLVTAKGGRVEGEDGSLLEIPEGALASPAIVKVITVLEAQLPSTLQEPGSYLGAVNIDTGGASFKKPVEISIPMPAGFDPLTAVFITKPSQIITTDELDPTQTKTEDVYQIIDSTKIVGNRISSACEPFDGVWGNTVVFTAFVDVTPVVVSGYTFQEMNDLTGYQPAPEGVFEVPFKDPATGNLTYKYDRPVPRAVIRAPSAWNYVSYTGSKGFYGTFAGTFTLPGEFAGDTNCMGYRLTATHPITMLSSTKDSTVCAKPYNVREVNFKLGEKGSMPPDKEPPTINISATMLPNQGTGTGFVGGVATVGTQLAVDISVTDMAMGTASLSVELASAAYANTRMTQLSLSDPTLTNVGSVVRYTYSPIFNDDYAGSSPQILKPGEPGLLRLIVDARDAAGNLSSKSFDIRVVNPGEQPVSRDGAPAIASKSPDDGAIQVRIDEPVKVVFSEGVSGVNSSTFTLFDVTGNAPVAATVGVDISNGLMKGLLVPKGNLAYGHTYRASLLAGITDVAPNVGSAGALLPLAPLTWQFTTKMPAAAELANGSFAARDIDYYYDQPANKLYAYVAAGTDGWRVVDVSNMNSMEVVWPDPALGIPSADFKFHPSMDYRNLAVDQQNSLLAMTDNFNMGIPEYHYGYVRFYSLANPKVPLLVGREKLAEAMSGVPLRVSILNDYAYVCTVGVGIQVVDIAASKARQQAGGASNGSAIVGYFDTNEPVYYGSPLFFAPYRSSAALLTTSSGKLLTLDLSFPTMPMLVTAYQPEDADSTATPKPKLRFGSLAAVADFAYRDAVGSLKMMDIAVAGVSSGGMRIVDVTDSSDPEIVGTVKNQDGSIASMITRDITINAALGLAVAPALDGVYVIDVRNPLDPRVLNKVSQLASSAVNADGTPVMVNLDGGQALIERDGKIYLASPGTATNGVSAVKAIDLGAGKKISCNQNQPCDP